MCICNYYFFSNPSVLFLEDIKVGRGPERSMPFHCHHILHGSGPPSPAGEALLHHRNSFLSLPTTQCLSRGYHYSDDTITVRTDTSLSNPEPKFSASRTVTFIFYPGPAGQHSVGVWSVSASGSITRKIGFRPIDVISERILRNRLCLPFYY